MNLEKLRPATGTDKNDLKIEYAEEVVRRLSRAIGERLTEEEAIALMWILQFRTWEYQDGFVINDLVEDSRSFGLVKAAAVAACFCSEVTEERRRFKDKNPDLDDIDYFKIEFPAYDQESDQYQKTMERLERKISADPTFRRFIDPDEDIKGRRGRSRKK